MNKRLSLKYRIDFCCLAGLTVSDLYGSNESEFWNAYLPHFTSTFSDYYTIFQSSNDP